MPDGGGGVGGTLSMETDFIFKPLKGYLNLGGGGGCSEKRVVKIHPIH